MMSLRGSTWEFVVLVDEFLLQPGQRSPLLMVKRFTTQISPCLIVLGVFVAQKLVIFGALTPGDQMNNSRGFFPKSVWGSPQSYAES